MIFLFWGDFGSSLFVLKRRKNRRYGIWRVVAAGTQGFLERKARKTGKFVFTHDFHPGPREKPRKRWKNNLG
jgi:hypothetical protein